MAFTYKTIKEEEAAKKKVAQDESNLRNHQTYQPGTYTQSEELNGMWNNISNWETPTWDKSNNTWWNKLTDTMNAIENRQPFSYDVNGDALYQQYKDQYINQGKMAMMDTMGQAAAMTGGYGNSYAQSVGQQAYQGYLTQLTDKIPELYQLAMSKYQMEGDELQNRLASYGSLYSTEYGEHRDAVADSKDHLSHLTNLYGIKSDEEYGQWYDNEKMNMEANQQAYNKLADLLGISTQAAQTLHENAYKSQFDTYQTGYAEEQDKIAHDLALDKLAEEQRQFNIANGLNADGTPRVDPDDDKPSDPGDDDDKPGEDKPTYKSIYADCNAYIANGASRSNISTYIRNALKEGYITQAEYDKLKGIFLPSGSSGSGGRYTY